MTSKDFLERYTSKFGTDYPHSSDAFYSFCDIVYKPTDDCILGESSEYFEESTGNIVSHDVACNKKGLLIKGYDVRSNYTNTPINRLVNYVRGKSLNSSIDFDAIHNSGCIQLISLVDFIVKRNGGSISRQLWDFRRLCSDTTIKSPEESDDVKVLVSDLFAEYLEVKTKDILENRWKGFSVRNSRGMDALARL